MFAAPRAFLGADDFVRLWTGLRSDILPGHVPSVAKQFPDRFRATMKSGKTAEFSRRPNKLFPGSQSTHAKISPAGKPNPGRHALPIDKVRLVIGKPIVEPIVFRHARAAVDQFYAAEFRRLLELNARRAAKRR